MFATIYTYMLVTAFLICQFDLDTMILSPPKSMHSDKGVAPSSSYLPHFKSTSRPLPSSKINQFN